MEEAVFLNIWGTLFSVTLTVLAAYDLVAWHKDFDSISFYRALHLILDIRLRQYMPKLRFFFSKDQIPAQYDSILKAFCLKDIPFFQSLS